MIGRRGFLKLAAASGIAMYAEPIVRMALSYRDWIEDRGDFFIVRVPDFKSFANEDLSKPVVFLLGQQAAVRAVRVAGFVNVQAPRGAVIAECEFDARMVSVGRDRPVVTLAGNDIHMRDSRLLCGAVTAGAFEYQFPADYLSLEPPFVRRLSVA
jgi:hypothetical protein